MYLQLAAIDRVTAELARAGREVEEMTEDEAIEFLLECSRQQGPENRMEMRSQNC